MNTLACGKRLRRRSGNSPLIGHSSPVGNSNRMPWGGLQPQTVGTPKPAELGTALGISSLAHSVRDNINIKPPPQWLRTAPHRLRSFHGRRDTGNLAFQKLIFTHIPRICPPQIKPSKRQCAAHGCSYQLADGFSALMLATLGTCRMDF